jgi:hypothetical protein
MSPASVGSPPEELGRPFSAALAGNALLAWRAITRHRPFRIAAPIMILLGASAPALGEAFFFFVADHTRVELPASNIFLWTAGYALLLLPAAGRGVSCRHTSVFGALSPGSTTATVAGRFAGLYAAYCSVCLLLVLLAAVAEAVILNGPVGPLLIACLPQLALGSVLVAAVFLFSQAGGALFTAACGVLWFVLATQKCAVLAAVADGPWRVLSQVALAWLPDLGLLRVSPDVIRPQQLAQMIGYAALFVALYLLLAVFRVRFSWRRPRGSTS